MIFELSDEYKKELIDRFENINIIEDLVKIQITYLDFNNKVKEGNIICNRLIANKLINIFNELYDNNYQIEKINAEEWEKLERRETTLEKLRVNRFARLHREYGFSEEYGAAAARLYAGNLGKYAPLVPDAETVLAQLGKRYDLYIITNGISETQHSRFGIAGLSEYVKSVFISEELGAAKPAPLFFDKVIGSIGDRDLGNYAVIGDSLTSDIEGAYNYGIDSIWINPDGKTDSRPTYTVRKLSDILNLL